MSRSPANSCQARPAEIDRCVCVQDTKLTNAAAWDSLAAGNGNAEEDGQKGAEEEEDNEGGLWNNFQARDDVERAEVCSAQAWTAALQVLRCENSIAAMQEFWPIGVM